VIVDEIHVVSLTLVETKDDAPVARHGHCPQPSQITFERVKLKAWKSHVSNFYRLVQTGQYSPDFVHVSWREAPMVVEIVESFKTPMFERRDHYAA
jgi:hypothetical protein